MKNRFLLHAALFSLVCMFSVTIAPHAHAQTQCAPDDYACAAAQQAANPQNSPTATAVSGSASHNSGGGNFLINPLKNINSLSDLLEAIIGALTDIGTIVLVLAFVWVGFSFVRAQGKPAELEKAKSALIWTIIGGAILLGAKAISLVIQSTVQSL
jgi:hypothetical protein